MLVTGPKRIYPEVFFSKIGVSNLSCGLLKRNSWAKSWNMAKTRKNKKVNKGPSATWWPNFGKKISIEIDFDLRSIIPDTINHFDAAKKT